MEQNRSCPSCREPVDPSDRFCRWCGTSLATSSVSTPGAEPGVCPVCGERNAPGSGLCRSCGASLGKPARSETRSKAGARVTVRLRPKRLLSGLAVLLAAALVVWYFWSRPGSRAGGAAPDSTIDSLTAVVENNSADPNAVLRLANRLHDAHRYQEAIRYYARYLNIQPADADARVDMGVSYFDLSLTDSLRQREYLEQAYGIVAQALTYAPRHQMASFNLAIISFHLGKPDEGNRWLQQCVAIDSTTEIARKAKELLVQQPFTTQSPS